MLRKKPIINLVSSLVIFIGLFLSYQGLFGSNGKLVIEQFLAEPGPEDPQGNSINLKIRACDKREASLNANLNFGDGRTESFIISCGQEIIKRHTYRVSGRTLITLSVKNSFGEEKRRELELDIRNFAPIIKEFNISPLSNLNAGQVTVFDIAICDASGDISRAILFSGDGRSITLDPSCDLSSYSIIYQNEGIYKARVEVEDSVGQRVERSLTVNIGRVAGEVIPSSFPNDLRRRLVRTSPGGDIFYITNSLRRRKFPNMNVFSSYGNRLEDVILIPESKLFEFPEVKLIHLDGEEPLRIFWLDRGTKRLIATRDALVRLGFQNEPIAPVNITELISYPTGEPIY